MELLLEILAAKRPFNDPYEKEFVQKVVIERVEKLGFSTLKIGPMENIVVVVPGGNEKVLFSCHTDTVHNKGGPQAILADANFGVAYVADQTKHDCLGADDGTGVWILLKMIEAKIPGTYVFHRGEERGCVGSGWMADDKRTQELLRAYDYAIAFDRKDRDDIITHQRSRRCCSETFATALAKALNDENIDFKYKPSPHGIYTDTANYDGLIRECTNISVGYEGAHGSGEMQDLNHAMKLLEAAKKVKWDKLPAFREAKRETYSNNYSHRGGYTPPPSSGNYAAYGRQTAEYGGSGNATSRSVTPGATLSETLKGLAATYASMEGRNRVLDATVRLMANPPFSLREIISESMKKGGTEEMDDYLMAMIRFHPEMALMALRSGLVYFQHYSIHLKQIHNMADAGILGYTPHRTGFLLDHYDAGQYGILFDKEKPTPPYKPKEQLELVETDPKKAALRASREKRKADRKARKAAKRAKKAQGRQFTHGLSPGTLRELKNTKQPDPPSKTNIVNFPAKTPELSWPSLDEQGPTAKNVVQ